MFLRMSWSWGSEDLVEVRILVAGSRWRGRWVYVSRESSVADIVVDCGSVVVVVDMCSTWECAGAGVE